MSRSIYLMGSTSSKGNTPSPSSAPVWVTAPAAHPQQQQQQPQQQTPGAVAPGDIFRSQAQQPTAYEMQQMKQQQLMQQQQLLQQQQQLPLVPVAATAPADMSVPEAALQRGPKAILK